MNPASIAFALHVLSAVVWIGGMFFAYLALRPAAGFLDPPARFMLWSRTFERFFRFVWIAITLLLASGYFLIFNAFGGFTGLVLHINLMQGIGIIMMLIFAHVYFAPYRRFKRAVVLGDHDEAARKLAQIRRFVAINLTLGIVTIIIATVGR